MVFVTHDLVEAINLADRIILMSPRPGRIACEYRMDLPRPRGAPEVQFSPAFQELHRRIRLDLNAEPSAEESEALPPMPQPLRVSS